MVIERERQQTNDVKLERLSSAAASSFAYFFSISAPLFEPINFLRRRRLRLRAFEKSN